MDSLNPEVIQEAVNKIHDIIVETCEKLSSTEYNSIEKYILNKYLEKYKNPPQPKSDKLRKGTFVESRENLVINTDKSGSYCVGFYDEDAQETLPLTEEKKKYAESLNIKVL